MPVPAGPTPKTIVCSSMAAAGQDVEGEDVGRPLGGLLAQHDDRSLDVVAAQRLAGGDDREQLVEQPLEQGDLGGGAGRGDLVAADEDVELGERPLDRAQQRVGRAEQGDHRDVG